MFESRLSGAEVFHPDLRALSRVLPRSAVSPRTLAVARLALKALPDTPGVRVAHVAKDVSVRLHIPAGLTTPAPALLWIHGGGLVMGNARQDDLKCQALARELGIIVAAVDHRLAPEDRFPAGVEDCHAAFTWLAARDDVDASRVAVAGGSAGGGLAAAVALMARDRGGVQPCFQLLVYPMLDDRTVLRSDPLRSRRRLWSNEANRFGWTSYLGVEPGGPGVSPLAAPGRNEDFTGLPPTWIGVGALDLFYDENVAYFEGLAAAGVPCELRVVPGAFHGFDALASAPVAKDFAQAQVDALRAALVQ